MTEKPTAPSSLRHIAGWPIIAAALGVARRHPYFAGLGMSGLALGVAILLNAVLGIDRPSRIFLVAILVTAASNGLWPALFASLISALFFDFFFLPPPFSFSIDTAEGVTDFVFFIATALIVTTLAARVRRYAVEADERALTAEKLSTFSRQLADALTEQDVLDTAARSIAASFLCSFVLSACTSLSCAVRSAVSSFSERDSDLSTADFSSSRC